MFSDPTERRMEVRLTQRLINIDRALAYLMALNALTLLAVAVVGIVILVNLP